MSETFEPAKNPESPGEKLSLKTKISFGSGDLGSAITANILIFFLSPFLTDVAGLRPGLAGWSQLVGKVWDAVNDPVVGVLSDRTENRKWGRRYPWILWGALPFGAFFFLQWIVPRFSSDPNTNQWGMFFYYTIISILFNTFYTVVNLPYTALTPELTDDYDERTNLNSFRFFFSIGGSILSVIIFAVIQAVFAQNPAQQYIVMGVILSIISVVPLYLCVWGTKDRVFAIAAQNPVSEAPVEIPIFAQLKIALSNRPFLFVVGIYLCSWLSVQLTAAIIPYFIRNVMNLADPWSLMLTILAVQATAMIMLPIWSSLSERVGKRGVYFMGMGLWIIAQAGLFFIPANQVNLMYVLAIMAGVGVSIAYLVPWSMLPDVIELDELQTGQRREGIFYSFITLFQKICLGFAVAFVLQSLEWTGYIKPSVEVPLPQQPDAVLTAIRMAIGPIPTLSLIIGLVLVYFYPLTRDVHTQIRLQLHEQRNQLEERRED